MPTRRQPARWSLPTLERSLEVLEDRCLLSFSAAVIYPAGLTPRATAASDFNNDGHTDLVSANRGENTLSVLLGNGDGTFQDASLSATGLRLAAHKAFNACCQKKRPHT